MSRAVNASGNGAAGESGGLSGGGGGGGQRIGETLVTTGEITEEQLQRALTEQRRTGRKLGETLVEQGVLSAGALVKALARSQGIRGCRLRHGLLDPSLMELIGREEAERLGVIPMFRVRGVLTVAMSDPRNLPVLDRLAELTSCRVRPVLTLESDIKEYLAKVSGEQVDVDEFLSALTESDVEVIEREAVDEQMAADLGAMVEGSPIVNLVNVAVLTAVRDGASDIHIEPSQGGTRIRCRIDGVLRDLMRPPAGMHAAIVSRVKVIGKMDIAEKRLPQEGRVRIVAEGRQIDLRVSSLPTLLGEKLVIRILDKGKLRVRMEELGFRQQALETLQRALKQPHGLVLVTGPTGSGKTTTLYSALDLLRSPTRNIVTVEDPVEYQLDLINQIQVNDSIGLSFARSLRSILRQDPDVIMVGEIRDRETARVAVQAALTGHLVLATLHTNDAPGTVARLRDMEIEAFLLSSSLNAVVAQRLARTLCASCVGPYYPSEDVLKQAGLAKMSARAFKRGGGCPQCHDSGFRGRLGIYEVMEITGAIRRLIYQDVPTHQIRRQHTEDGGKTLREEGVHLALAGKTSLEEVLRVTRTDDGEDETAASPVAAASGPVAAASGPALSAGPGAPGSSAAPAEAKSNEAKGRAA